MPVGVYVRTKEHKCHISKALKGRLLSPEHRIKCANGRKGKHLSEEHKYKISYSLKGRPHSKEHNKKVSESLMGHPVTKEQIEKQRLKVIKDDATKKITKWREAVFQAGNGKCIKCGRDYSICSHHILSRDEFPALKYDVTNGVSLCRGHHMVYHRTYGEFGTRETLLQYLGG